MCVHFNIIIRKCLEEIYHIRNVTQGLDTGLYEVRNCLLVTIACNDLLNVRKSKAVVLFGLHGLQVLTVHPAELDHVKHCGRLADLGIIELVDKLLQTHDLAVVCGTPAQECNEIDDRIGYKTLLEQILEARVSAPL